MEELLWDATDFQEEEAEAAMMDVRLVQTKLMTTRKAPLHRHAHQDAEDAEMDAGSAAARGAPSQVASTGDATAASAAAGDRTGSIVTMDHNGKVCMLCNAPPAERVGAASYEAFRTDCGARSSPTGPSASDLTRPAVQFMQIEGRETNGFCELNFAKGCVDAIANRDYLYWAKSLNMEHPVMKPNAPWDARYCKKNGFLEPALVQLQHNFTGLQSTARELCRTKYAKYGINKLSFIDMMSKARYDDGEAPSLAEAEELAAWNCAMGDLGCDMAMCAYSFCTRSDGTLGLYGECEGWDPVEGMPSRKDPSAAPPSA
jgi:hypothetical protein